MDELTKDQEKLMHETRDYWFQKALNCEPLDKQAFEKGIRWIYTEVAGKAMPEIIYCDSWREAVDKIYDNKVKWFKEKGIKPEESIMKKENIHSEYSSYAGFSNFGWTAFYEFYDKIGKLNNDSFKNYRDFIASNAFLVFEYDEFVYCVETPEYIKVSENEVLHCVDGPAIKFKNGEGVYFINGRHIPNSVYEQTKSMTKEIYLGEQNMDYRAAWYEYLGSEKIMEILRAELIDTKEIIHNIQIPLYGGYDRHANTEGLEDIKVDGKYITGKQREIVELYQTKERIVELGDCFMQWVKFTCPSTGSHYLIDVEPIYTDALSAAASTSPFDVKPEEYNFTQRS